MKHVFEEAKLGNLSVKNRLIRSATWEAVADEKGRIFDNAYKIYDDLAKGGTGLIITGMTSVLENDEYVGGVMRMSDDALIPQYKMLVDMIHQENCLVIPQLAIGAYYRTLSDGSTQIVWPDEMTLEELLDVKNRFVQAAIRAGKAGFDGIQIHLAHFWFLSRLVSPLTNHRTDEYGGSMENRCRLVVEIIEDIRKEMPDIHITTKINSSDFMQGGLTEADSLRMCEYLAEHGIDSIEVSGNGTSVSGIKAHKNEGYFLPFAAALAERINIPVIVVGGFRSYEAMEYALNNTKVEFISLSRPLIREPEYPNLLSSDHSYIPKCISCNRCYRTPEHKCIFVR